MVSNTCPCVTNYKEENQICIPIDWNIQAQTELVDWNFYKEAENSDYQLEITISKDNFTDIFDSSVQKFQDNCNITMEIDQNKYK